MLADPPPPPDISTVVLAIGAVGTAAMGVVEALKGTPLGLAGLETVKENLTNEAMTALRGVYGEKGFDALLAGTWRKGTSEIESFLRTGLRLAIFSAKDIEAFAKAFGDQQPATLSNAIEDLRNANPDAPATPAMAESRGRLARFESVVDARVSAAVAAGNDRYKYTMQVFAGGLCVVACASIAQSTDNKWYVGALVGLVAVPVAPVAKDFATFLTSVRDVFKKKGSPA